VNVHGEDLRQAIRRGCERATREHPLRSSVVHPITRSNEHTSCGRRVPVINFDFCDRADVLQIEMIPKGSGSENGSFLKMCIPADGEMGIKTFVVDKVVEAGGKVCPPTIVGVGVGALEYGWSRHWRSDPRCSVIPNGLDLGRFADLEPHDVTAAALKRELGLPADRSLIVHVGNPVAPMTSSTHRGRSS